MISHSALEPISRNTLLDHIYVCTQLILNTHTILELYHLPLPATPFL